jgi:hypothetical protein
MLSIMRWKFPYGEITGILVKRDAIRWTALGTRDGIHKLTLKSRAHWFSELDGGD